MSSSAMAIFFSRPLTLTINSFDIQNLLSAGESHAIARTYSGARAVALTFQIPLQPRAICSNAQKHCRDICSSLGYLFSCARVCQLYDRQWQREWSEKLRQ